MTFHAMSIHWLIANSHTNLFSYDSAVREELGRRRAQRVKDLLVRIHEDDSFQCSKCSRKLFNPKDLQNHLACAFTHEEWEETFPKQQS